MLLLTIAATCASAKDPNAMKPATLLPTIGVSVGSLTPPPKEWAMFPQDEPAPQGAQPPAQNAQNPGAPKTAGGTGTAASGNESSGGIVSAANVRQAPHKELPLFWMLLTGALSFGAITACGSLILRKDAASSNESEGTHDFVPVVPEHLEVKA